VTGTDTLFCGTAHLPSQEHYMMSC
jgi:hypothetical protein